MSRQTLHRKRLHIRWFNLSVKGLNDSVNLIVIIRTKGQT
jgi:hypothetical protein